MYSGTSLLLRSALVSSTLVHSAKIIGDKEALQVLPGVCRQFKSNQIEPRGRDTSITNAAEASVFKSANAINIYPSRTG